MNACDAAGLGRKIEVEGKKMTHPPVFDRYDVVSTEDITPERRKIGEEPSSRHVSH
jgi:hypothetical protein